MLNNLDFHAHIKELPDRELMEFIAQHQYDTQKLLTDFDSRIARLESNRSLGIGSLAIGSLNGLVFIGFIIGKLMKWW